MWIVNVIIVPPQLYVFDSNNTVIEIFVGTRNFCSCAEDKWWWETKILKILPNSKFWWNWRIQNWDQKKRKFWCGGACTENPVRQRRQGSSELKSLISVDYMPFIVRYPFMLALNGNRSLILIAYINEPWGFCMVETLESILVKYWSEGILHRRLQVFWFCVNLPCKFSFTALWCKSS